MFYTLFYFIYFLLDQSINIKTFINQMQNKSIFVCVISLFNISSPFKPKLNPLSVWV